MKNNKNLIALLLTCGLMLTGCKNGPCSHVDEDNNHLCDKCGETISECVDEDHDHKCDVCGKQLSDHADADGDHKCDYCGEGLPYVEKVEITGAHDVLSVGFTMTLKAEVTAPNGGSKEVEWSSSDTTVEVVDNGDGTATVKGKAIGSASVTVKSKADASVTDSVSFEVKNWEETDLAMMQEYLGGAVPYFGGSFTWTDYYYSRYSCLTAESNNAEDLELAIEGLENAGAEITDDNGLYYCDFCVDERIGLTLTFNMYVDGYGWAMVDVYSSYQPVDCEAWPASLISEFTPDSVKTPVPAAEGTKFQFKVSAATSVYFCSVYVTGNMDAYLAKLETNGFSVAFDSNYDCYTAKSSDLLIDVYESSDPEIFVISLYTYAEWPEDQLNAAMINLIGVEREIPSFTALQFAVQDYATYYGIVMVKSLDSDPLAGYIDELEDLEWVVNDNGNGSYEVIAPTEDFAMTVEWDDEYNGISLSIYPHSPMFTSWPTEFAAAQVTEIGATGTVPAYTSTNVQGYYTSEAALGYGPIIEVVCSASVMDAELVAYCEQLAAAGYFVAGDNYGDPIYAYEGTTLGISPYITYDGHFYIELLKLSAPAVKPETPAEGDLDAFPSDQLAAALGQAVADIVPAASGTSFSFAEETDGSYNITVYGGDRAAYVSALVDAASLTHDAVPASSSHAAYDSFYASDFSKGFDVHAADEDGTYVINVWAY